MVAKTQKPVRFLSIKVEYKRGSLTLILNDKPDRFDANGNSKTRQFKPNKSHLL
jgi:hypothetical protein